VDSQDRVTFITLSQIDRSLFDDDINYPGTGFDAQMPFGYSFWHAGTVWLRSSIRRLASYSTVSSRQPIDHAGIPAFISRRNAQETGVGILGPAAPSPKPVTRSAG